LFGAVVKWDYVCVCVCVFARACVSVRLFGAVVE